MESRHRMTSGGRGGRERCVRQSAFALAILLASVVGATAQPLPANLPLAELDGEAGLSVSGIAPFDLAGYWVRGVGDVNGDGLSDFAVSAPQAGPLFGGEVYLFFGSSARPASLTVSELAGTNGAVFSGSSVGESAGVAVSAAGDFNGDGFGDFILGAPFASPPGRPSAGQAYLVFGRESYAARVDLGALGGDGVTLLGADPFDQSGLSVSGGGDVDGDGFDDVIVSSHRADSGVPNTGAATVLFGSDSPAAILDLGAVPPGGRLRLVGDAEEDEAGFSVAHAGDVDGDGFDDVLVGAFRADPMGIPKAGKVYVVYGGPDLPDEIELASLDGSNGATFLGIDEKDEAGYAVAGAGDVNGDGFDDIAISAPAAAPDFVFAAGEAYVVYGGPALPAALALADLDGVNGTVFHGVDVRDQAGDCIAGLGDIDNDGFDDLLIGATLGDPGELIEAGEAYVVLGDPNLGAIFDLGLLDGSNGMRLDGAGAGHQAGFGCGGAGDMDGDGLEDVLVGAPTAGAPAAPEGIGYLVYGQAEIEVTLGGACPGDALLNASGLTAGGSVVVVTGDELGSFPVPSGPCSGESLDLARPTLGATLRADARGVLEIRRSLPAAGCGRRLQLLDLGTCRKSSLVDVPGSALAGPEVAENSGT